MKAFEGKLRITVKDDIALQCSLYFEIRKQHSNVVRLLCAYPFEWHSNVSHLTDSLKCHANSCKGIETTER